MLEGASIPCPRTLPQLPRPIPPQPMSLACLGHHITPPAPSRSIHIPSPRSVASSSSAAMPKKPRRQFSWADAPPTPLTTADSPPAEGLPVSLAASPLCAVRFFNKDEEPWRCGLNFSPPSLTPSPLSPLSSPPPSPPTAPLVWQSSKLVSLVQPAAVRRDRVDFCGIVPASPTELFAAVIAEGVRVQSVFVRAGMAFLTVRVHNVAFHKKVLVRWSVNHWVTNVDVAGSFASSAGAVDCFYATIALPTGAPGTVVEFAVAYYAGEREWWDNNGGANYRLLYLPPPV